MTERYEEGMRIISVETEEEFLEAMDQMTNYRVAIEAPEAVVEALAIDSAAVTDLVSQGAPLEDVRHLAGHVSPGTTQIYDRWHVTRNIVERISVCDYRNLGRPLN